MYICHNRYLNQQSRQISSLVLEISVASVAGLLMGLSAGAEQLFQGNYIKPFLLVSPSPLQWLVPLFGLLIGFSVALAGAPSSVKVL
jgi:hypothetical protein